jgi:hypothetical protein
MNTQNPLRQKFINMMYLILIALLLLNPPVEFVETFTNINRTIQRANDLIDRQNQFANSNLEDYSNQYNKQELQDKLEEAERMSDSAIHVLDTLKTFLINKAGGYNKFNFIKRAGDAGLPTRHIYRTDRATQLQNLLTSTKEKLMEIYQPGDGIMLDTVLLTKDSIPKSTGIYVTWEKYHFNNIPLSGVIATLSKFQNDVRIAQQVAYRNAQDSLGDASKSPLYAQSEQTSTGTADTSSGDEQGIDTINIEKRVKRFEVFNLGEEGITKIQIPDVPNDQLKDATLYTYDKEGNVVDSTRFYSGEGEIELKTDQVGQYTVKGEIAMKDNQKGKGSKTGGEKGSGQDTQAKKSAKRPGGGTSERADQQLAGKDTGTGPEKGVGKAPGKGTGKGPGEGPPQGKDQYQGKQAEQPKGEVPGKGTGETPGEGPGKGAGQGPGKGTGIAARDTSKQIKDFEDTEEKKIEFQYKVVNPKPYISQEKFNVFYQGVPNPIEIYHPLLNKRDYRVDITNGKILYKNDKYYAWAYRKGRANVKLSVRDKEGEMKKVTERTFQVKTLPKPEAVLHNKSGGKISPRILKMQKKLRAENPDLDIAANYKIVGFNITYINGQGGGMLTEEVKGAQFSGKARKVIDMAERGDIYIFDEIKVKGPDGRNMQIDGIVFNII